MQTLSTVVIIIIIIIMMMMVVVDFLKWITKMVGMGYLSQDLVY